MEREGEKEGIGGRREWRGKERSNERREEGKEIRRKGWRDRGRTEDKGFHLQKQTAISLVPPGKPAQGLGKSNLILFGSILVSRYEFSLCGSVPIQDEQVPHLLLQDTI